MRRGRKDYTRSLLIFPPALRLELELAPGHCGRAAIGCRDFIGPVPQSLWMSVRLAANGAESGSLPPEVSTGFSPQLCAGSSAFAGGVLSLNNTANTKISTADITAGTSQISDQLCVAPPAFV